MSGGVDVELTAVHHGGATTGQAVANGCDRRFVSGDGMGAEDDDVVVVDLDPLALAGGHHGQRRPRLTLRAGTHDANLGRVECVEVFDVADRVVRNSEDPHLASQPHVSAHREPERDQGTPGLDRDIGDLLQPVDVARECSDYHPPALIRNQQSVKDPADLPLGTRHPRAVGVGRVGQQ